MAPIQIGANGNPLIIPAEVRMPFPHPVGAMPRMVRRKFFSFVPRRFSSLQIFNPNVRPNAPTRPAGPPTANHPGMAQSMRFNLGTLPYTFMQMGPDGITLNQVSASVVADVQTSTSASETEQTTNNSTPRPTPSENPIGIETMFRLFFLSAR